METTIVYIGIMEKFWVWGLGPVGIIWLMGFTVCRVHGVFGFWV